MTLSQRITALATALVLSSIVGCSTAPLHRKLSMPVSVITRQKAQEVTVYALGLVGTPYRLGGNTPNSGFDCSGLIRHVYQTVSGITPPRTVAKLQEWGQPIDHEQLQTGDLVIFFIDGAVSHAGIYVGEGRFVHAPSTGGRVRMDSLHSNYWKAKTMTVRRP